MGTKEEPERISPHETFGKSWKPAVEMFIKLLAVCSGVGEFLFRFFALSSSTRLRTS